MKQVFTGRDFINVVIKPHTPEEVAQIANAVYENKFGKKKKPRGKKK